MRRFILLFISFMSLLGGTLRAQDGCGPTELNAEVDRLFATYVAERQTDPTAAVHALQAGLTEMLDMCPEATPEAESTEEAVPAAELMAGQWRLEWASTETVVCADSPITYTPRNLTFLLQMDGDDRFSTTDNYAWPPLVFSAAEDGDYVSTGSQRIDGVASTYNYRVTITSPEAIEGTGTAYVQAYDCTLGGPFEMTLVDETVTCMVNAQTRANLRGGPGTEFPIAGVMPVVDLQPVIGQAEDTEGFTWWQLSGDRWVRSDLVAEAGACEDVPEAIVEG